MRATNSESTKDGTLMPWKRVHDLETKPPQQVDMQKLPPIHNDLPT